MAQTSFPVIDLKATGERIKEVRQQKGITVKTLQTFLGFNEPVSIYKWQRGECLPTFDNMYAMACLFGVGIDDLLVGNRQEVFLLYWYLAAKCGIGCAKSNKNRHKTLIYRDDMLKLYLYVNIFT